MPTNTRDWTVVTVTYNSAKALREFWSFVDTSAFNWVVVDNGSSDDSVRAARELGASTVVDLGANVGFSSANNVGARFAGGRYIAFVNPDVTPVLADLPDMSVWLESHRSFLAPQLLNRDGSLQPNGRGLPYLTSKIRHRLPAAHRTEGRYRRYSAPGQESVVAWATGAAICAKVEHFQQAGGWDPRFFLYQEDTELCLSAAQLGIQTTVSGDFRWLHGWARESSEFRLAPLLRELSASYQFYRKRPNLLVGRQKAGTIEAPLRLDLDTAGENVVTPSDRHLLVVQSVQSTGPNAIPIQRSRNDVRTDIGLDGELARDHA